MGHTITKTQKADAMQLAVAVTESMDLATSWKDLATSWKPSWMKSPCVICTDRAREFGASGVGQACNAVQSPTRTTTRAPWKPLDQPPST